MGRRIRRIPDAEGKRRGTNAGIASKLPLFSVPDPRQATRTELRQSPTRPEMTDNAIDLFNRVFRTAGQASSGTQRVNRGRLGQ
jgi:hypothetical protein